MIDNEVLSDNKFVSKEMAGIFNDILKGLPELYTIIGKVQHKTHDYTVDVHTLVVLQECVNNPFFNTLNSKEKHELMFASLLHDITKEENTCKKGNYKYTQKYSLFLMYYDIRLILKGIL